ncbi:MAG: T9SS type A sorting domain-containing protein [Ignavibacteria bacterium]|nr:T9SS type A sorting domain-containing protein [Ignavibacteria bacterium]
MKKIYLLLLAWLLLIFAGSAVSQTLHNVEVSSFMFTPSTVTITVGDTVRWTNVNGTHNVVADDNSFTSGAPAPPPWEFDFVFTTVGDNPYYCEPHGGPGGSGMSGVITVQNPTSVNEDGITVDDFELKQNYPNPFNPSTKISFVIPVSGNVNLKVFNILGNEITTLLNEQLFAGEHTVPFNAAGLSSGIYFYALTVNGNTQTKEMVLLK